jgi:hypothetical protein
MPSLAAAKVTAAAPKKTAAIPVDFFECIETIHRLLSTFWLSEKSGS